MKPRPRNPDSTNHHVHIPSIQRPPAEPGAEGDHSGDRKHRVLATFITTTSYGTRLPGDPRGYVDSGRILSREFDRQSRARGEMWHAPVFFSAPQIIVLDFAIREAANEFGYTLTDLAIERSHLHWIITHGFDPVKVMVGRLKTRMRQMIRRGRIWTDGYCHRCLSTQTEIETARRYISRHDGCRLLNGQLAGAAATRDA